MSTTALLACGSPAIGVLVPADTGQVITILNYEFIPQRLTVAAGSSVLIRNEDPFPHSVTSESTPGAYTPGAVSGVQFETGTIAARGTWTISIPAGVPAGTVVPYYCALHGIAMVNQGELVIAAP